MSFTPHQRSCLRKEIRDATRDAPSAVAAMRLSNMVIKRNARKYGVTEAVIRDAVYSPRFHKQVFGA